MKWCSRCKETKSLDLFAHDKHNASGTKSWCKVCSNAYARAQRATPEGKALWKGFRETSRAKPKTQAYDLAYSRLYAARPERKAKVLVYNREHTAERKSIDENFCLRVNLRPRVVAAYKEYHCSSASYFELLGCTSGEFQAHIKSMFARGMSRENYGRLWELHYIVPLAAFDLTNATDKSVAFNWSNIRPMWAAANASARLDLQAIEDLTLPSGKPVSDDLRRRLFAWAAKHPAKPETVETRSAAA